MLRTICILAVIDNDERMEIHSGRAVLYITSLAQRSPRTRCLRRYHINKVVAMPEIEFMHGSRRTRNMWLSLKECGGISSDDEGLGLCRQVVSRRLLIEL